MITGSVLVYIAEASQLRDLCEEATNGERGGMGSGRFICPNRPSVREKGCGAEIDARFPVAALSRPDPVSLGQCPACRAGVYLRPQAPGVRAALQRAFPALKR